MIESNEHAKLFSGVYYRVETSSKRAAERTAYLIAECVGIYTIQSGRIQEGRGHHTLQGGKGSDAKRFHQSPINVLSGVMIAVLVGGSVMDVVTSSSSSNCRLG